MNYAEKELEGCIRFFLENSRHSERTFGMVKDIFPSNDTKSSIAGNGYFFLSLVLAAKEGLLSQRQAQAMALEGLSTLEHLERVQGFYYHFYDVMSGKKKPESEVSTIDTAILFVNLLTCGSFFHGEVEDRVNRLVSQANWPYFLTAHPPFFQMAIDRNGKIFGLWDHYAEQLMMYVLAAGSPDPAHRVGKEAYETFYRDKGTYEGLTYIYSWEGSLFTYQFSQEFIDFRGRKDRFGTDWHENSRLATEADCRYCILHHKEHPTYGEKAFGLTACLCKSGYQGGYGAGLMGEKEIKNDGTVAPCGALGSLPILPERVRPALEYYGSLPLLWGPYGFYDAFNLEQSWFATRYVSIDKGITLASLANDRDETVWALTNANPIIQKGLDALGIEKAR
ncbi:MAG: hypothetical protein LKM30_07565 [Bacilli bacterium]|jgi:hypothetical protein|nr:hypothetical protein [Bacilli bacterium]